MRTLEVSAGIDLLEGSVLQRLAALPEQPVHNDLNPHNIVVDDDEPARVAGLIDFGDMIRAPRSLELATAGAYHATDPQHPLEAVTTIASAYHAITPLTREELSVIPALMIARLALSLTINRWLAVRHPDNSDYLLRNADRKPELLAALAEIDHSSAGHAFAELVSS